ncbi:MAG: helix-turn-helix domain-containing protein [Syntrophomonadaceae bacterium]|jgi:cytoskeleton protein RodZ
MTLGELLKHEREKQGFSLEAVEEETKIRKFYLQAIERGDWASLPPKVYATGFVKRYARFLGLDEEELGKQFKEQFYPEQAQEKAIIIPEKMRSTEEPGIMKNIAAAAVFLIIVLLAGNFIVNILTGPDNLDIPPNNPTVQQPGTNNDENNQNQEEYEPPKIEIQAVMDCWLRIVVDGEEVYSGILKPGESKVFSGNDSLYLKAGNAGGINILYNGEPMESLGGIGEVVEKEIPF